MNRKIYKIIILVLAVLSLNNIILLIRNYSYAYFEKNIKTGVKLKITTLDEMPVKGSPSANTLKEKLGQPGEIIGVTNDNQKATTDNGNIREYRYSGLNVNNYIYFNCTDEMEQNNTNCETWRIIGIFKDEEGGEHLKIVRNAILTGNMFPIVYTINYATYTYNYNIRNTKNTNEAYHNYNADYSYVDGNNDWSTSGLQYYLNTENDVGSNKGYFSYLHQSAKDMIAIVKYYLGNTDIDSSTYNMKNSANEAYQNERKKTGCGGSSKFSCPGGSIWPNNQAIWEGKVALIYPSDYGYSADSSYWDTSLGNFETASNTSWLAKNSNHSNAEWQISPVSYCTSCVSRWSGGTISSNYDLMGNSASVRPCLYLKSEVKIIDGTGESTNPYQLEYTI